MELTDPVKRILSNYESDNPGTKANLARILLQGRLDGTGRLLTLPVRAGVKHDPARSFAPNPAAYKIVEIYQAQDWVCAVIASEAKRSRKTERCRIGIASSLRSSQ